MRRGAQRCVELRSEARTTRCDRSKKEKPAEAGRRVASDTVQQVREGLATEAETVL